jgi:hypothetical protein
LPQIEEFMSSKSQSRFLFLKISTTCLLHFISTANAAPLNHELPSGSIKFNFLHHGILKKTPVLIDFNKMKPLNLEDLIRQNYLTFYSNKNEKLRATYEGGAYAINYTQKW